jgi:hypothetical protein
VFGPNGLANQLGVQEYARAPQARQFRVTSRRRLAADMFGQQLISPEFLGITQIPGLLARQILSPYNGIVRYLARLSRPWQLSQCRLLPKSKVFSNAKNHGISIHLTGRSIRLVRNTIGRIQFGETGRKQP